MFVVMWKSIFTTTVTVTEGVRLRDTTLVITDTLPLRVLAAADARLLLREGGTTLTHLTREITPLTLMREVIIIIQYMYMKRLSKFFVIKVFA